MAENDVQDSTPRGIDNFVASLSDELQGIVRNGNPQKVVDAVVQVANSLDPDLAAAFNAGNPTIIQAVMSGMTTTHMVVNEIVRTGVSSAGLPPGVASLVEQQKAKNEQQRELENAALKKELAGFFGLATGVAGMTAMANGAKAAENGTSAPSNQPVDYGMPISSMSEAQRAAYWDGVINMTQAQWDAMPAEQQQKIQENNTTAAKDHKKEAQESISAWDKDLDAQVKAGKITQAQADDLRQRAGEFDFIKPGENGGFKINRKALDAQLEEAEKMESPMKELYLARIKDEQRLALANLAEEEAKKPTLDGQQAAAGHNKEADLVKVQKRALAAALKHEGYVGADGKLTEEGQVFVESRITSYMAKDGRYTAAEQAFMDGFRDRVDDMSVMEEIRRSAAQTAQLTSGSAADQIAADSELSAATSRIHTAKTANAAVETDELSLDAPSTPVASVAARPTITIPGDPPVIGEGSPMLAQLGAAPSVEPQMDAQAAELTKQQALRNTARPNTLSA